MTTDIRAHLLHNLELDTIDRKVEIYCRTCDLYMSNLNTVTIAIDNIMQIGDQQ